MEWDDSWANGWYVFSSPPVDHWTHCLGDYVRNKAHTETGEIVAIDQGYAWVRVSDKKRVSILLSDLEPAPKPLQVGDRVTWGPTGVAIYELLAIDNGVAFIKRQNGSRVDYFMPALENLERA